MGRHMGHGLVPPDRYRAGRLTRKASRWSSSSTSAGTRTPAAAISRASSIVPTAPPSKPYTRWTIWVPFMDAEGNAQVPVAEDGSFTLYLEAASNPLLLGVPPFIETELGDHATGKPDEPYVFKSADLAEFDERYENYSVDLDVVSSLMEFADKQSPRYWQLAKALQRSLNAYDERNPESVEAARAALAGVLAKPANASAMNVSAIGHAHIDSAWLWPVRETRRKVARTVSNALALMDADPDFKYAMSSAQQYAWLEEDHPDIFKRMKRRIEEGRFIPVGGMWVEADGMLPAGESLIRQIAYGRKYFKEHLGVEPKGVWLPDSFGYTGAWPQIARRAGTNGSSRRRSRGTIPPSSRTTRSCGKASTARASSPTSRRRIPMPLGARFRNSTTPRRTSRTRISPTARFCSSVSVMAVAAPRAT